MNTERYFAIFVTHHYHSCGVTYNHLTTKKTESYMNSHGNYRYRTVDAPLHVYRGNCSPRYPEWENSAYKFKTAEEALAKAKELQAQGILPSTQGAVAFPRPVQIKVGETAEYGSTDSVISILQRPLSDIIGKYRAFAVTFAQEHPDFEYDNAHRYQLARSRRFGWEYLIYDRATKSMEWTPDCTKATLFTADEQDKVAEYANEIGGKEIPYKGYVQAQNLPAKHDNAPKFKRGDIVRYKEDGEVKEFQVWDIISFGKGWQYEVGCDYCGFSTSIASERFFETSPFTDLFKEEELTLVKAG